MRLATFRLDDAISWGVEAGGGIAEVRTLSQPGVPDLPATLMALVEAGDAGLLAVAAALERFEGAPVPVERVEFLPPLLRPGKLLCLALNNSANAARIHSGPAHPAFFSKPSTALIGHGAAIPLRAEYGRVHPEPELAVIIGRGGRDIDAGDAYAHVFGYTVHNDVTSPTMRAEDTYHYRAIHPDGEAGGIRYVDTHVSYPGRYKGADGFGPMGPWLVTRDEVPDPHALQISCWHEDRLVTRDSTANLTHHLPAVLAWLSRFLTLEAGDIVSLGTALSVAGDTGGAIQNVDLNRLGGTVTITIEGVGTLRNGVSVRL